MKKSFLSWMVAASALVVPAAAWADGPPGAKPAEGAPAAEAKAGEAPKGEAKETGKEAAAEPGKEGKEAKEGKEGEGKEGGEKEGEERRWVFGAALVGLAPAGQKEETQASLGGGVFAEYTFVPGWLQGEVGLRFLAEGKDKTVMPIDLLVKKPFELTETAEVFIGLGATIVPTIAGTGDTHAGFASAVGSYFWLTKHAGLAFELNYNVLAAESPISEFGGALGLVYGL